MLAAIVIPLAALALFGLVVLWPDGDGPQDRALDNAYAGGTVLTGTVQRVDSFACPSAEEGPEGDSVTCLRAQVELDDEPTRTVEVDIPAGVDQAEPGVGLRLLHARVGPADNRSDYYAFIDFQRDFPMGLLAFAYAALAIAVARMRGLRALLGLVTAFGVLAVFMLPALLEGKPPVLVGLTGATAIMLVVLYLAHGFSARTTTALLGTMAGLAVTAVLGGWATSGARLTGMASEESGVLQLATGGSLDLSSVVLCGIVLAGLGVLNDVTITQASAVWELHALSPRMSPRRLFTGAMRIGRDHIASTIYTIAFAYAGAALPTLLLLSLYERPLGLSVTGGELAEEIVRTLVGSIGLVLAIPLTTAIAVLVVKAAAAGPSDDPTGGSEPSRPAPGHGLGEPIRAAYSVTNQAPNPSNSAATRTGSEDGSRPSRIAERSWDRRSG